MNTTEHNEINIGIDTSSTMLDVYVRPLGFEAQFENNAQGIKQAVKYMKGLSPTRVLIEATGRLELALNRTETNKEYIKSYQERD